MTLSADRLPRSRLELVAVGDISLGDSAQAVGGGVHARFERIAGARTNYPFEHVSGLFDGAAIVFGNLETVLSHHDMDRRKAASVEMRGHPDAADRMCAAGFTVLNVANNHMMQHGMSAFSETVDLLRHKHIEVVGLASRDDRGCIPQVVSSNGLSVTMLGFAFERDKYAPGPVGYAFGPDCDILRQVALAKQRTDIVVCSVHWGLEFVRHPAPFEEKLGHQLIDAGADLVLGHHPHVARRLETYGRGLIAYSLGNFVFDMLWDPWLRTGIVLRVVLTRNGVESYGIEPVWIGDDYQPHPMSGKQRDETIAALTALQDPPEWAIVEDLYQLQYQELVVKNRHESYRYFLRHIGSRPLAYTAQTLLRTARRKAAALFASQ